ncbi:MAG: hemolysin III family protein [Chloroflexota bacterium]
MSPKIKNLKERASLRIYTLGEEIVHSITHGIGAGLSIAGLVVLVVLAARRGDVYQIVSFSIYGAMLILLYLASTLYHGFQHPQAKQVFQIIDHASIYLLIAGTYTPFLLVGIRGVLGWTLLAIIWGLAVIGVGFKALAIHRFEKLSVLAYILMGWLCVVMLKELLSNIPIGGLIWLAVGGVVYTVGVIFYALRKIPYMHAIWHLFVLGGSICHYFAVLLYLAPVS